MVFSLVCPPELLIIIYENRIEMSIKGMSGKL